jgi:hypothetical protein
MSKTKLALSILGILFGIFVFVYGGYDDSPGAQLLGAVIAAIGIISILRGQKKQG